MTWLNFISGHVILCQLLVRSGKSQLNNYANAHCFSNIWLMSYRVETLYVMT